MRFFPETLRGPRGVKIVLLVAVLFVAGSLRLRGIGEGLPYLHDWDEPQIASTALNMMKTGDFNPHFFHYGSLVIYAQLGVDVVHYVSLMRHEPIPFPVVPGIFSHEEIDLGAIETWFETGFLWEVSHPSFYRWNRGFNALLGTATVLVTFLLGRALAQAWVGLAAAALLAVQGFHVERSVIVNPDVAMTLCALVAVYGSVVFLQRASTRWWLLALAFCGLSASAKYNGIYCGLAPLVALVLAARDRPVAAWHWGALPVVPMLAFFATTPYAVLDLPAFLAQAGFEIYHYTARGHGAVPVEAGWPHLVVQSREVVGHFGWLGTLLAVTGVAVMLFRRESRRVGWVCFVYPLVYFVYMATTRAAFHRNLLVIYPFLALAVALTLLAWSQVWTRQAVMVLAVVVLSGLQLYKLIPKYAEWNRPETRTQALDAISEMGRDAGDGFVAGLAEEVRFHRVDLERLGVAFEVKPHLDLVCDPSGYDVVVTGARYAGLWSTRPDAKRKARLLNQATLEGLERREIGGPLAGGNVTRLDAASQNPVLHIYLTRGYSGPMPEVCPNEAIE